MPRRSRLRRLIDAVEALSAIFNRSIQLVMRTPDILGHLRVHLHRGRPLGRWAVGVGGLAYLYMKHYGHTPPWSE